MSRSTACVVVGRTRWRRFLLAVLPATLAVFVLGSLVMRGMVPVVLAGGGTSGPFSADFGTISVPSGGFSVTPGTTAGAVTVSMNNVSIKKLGVQFCPIGLVGLSLGGDAQAQALNEDTNELGVNGGTSPVTGGGAQGLGNVSIGNGSLTAQSGSLNLGGNGAVIHSRAYLVKSGSLTMNPGTMSFQIGKCLYTGG